MSVEERAKELYEKHAKPKYHEWDDLPAWQQRSYLHVAQAELAGEVVRLPE